MKAVGRQSFLIVFDFDHTVVDCNTDEVIPNHFHLHNIQKKLKNEHKIQWTKLMDTLMSKFKSEEIAKAAKASVEMEDDMKKVFEYLITCKNQYRLPQKDAQQPQHRVPEFVEINIASDANLLFIDAALDANLPFLKPHLSHIHSNPYYDLCAARSHEGGGAEDEDGLQRCYGAPKVAEVLRTTNQNDEAERDALLLRLLQEESAEDGANYERIVAHLRASHPAAGEGAIDVAALPRQSRISWYEPFGHQCPCCLHRGKPNMCKTKIIQRLLNATTTTDTTIIFIGDGANDYCPILNLLRPRDFMFARKHFPIHEILSTAVPTPAAAAAAAHAAEAGTQNPSHHHHPYFRHEGNVVGGCCHIGLWENAAELLKLFQAVLQEPVRDGAAPPPHAPLPPRLPTLARFNDVNPAPAVAAPAPCHEEFRTVTIHKRMKELIDRTTRLLASESDPDVTFALSATAKLHIQRLVDSTVRDDVVPLLPGQTAYPNWLRGFAYAAEANHCATTPTAATAADVTSRASVVSQQQKGEAMFVPVGPRWGQLPWLHGEIYFYHLLFQYLLLKDDTNTENNTAAAADWIERQKEAILSEHREQADMSEEEKAISFYKAFHTINAITPTMMYNPLSSQETNFNHPDSYTFETNKDNNNNEKSHAAAIITGGLVVPPVMPHQTDADAQILFHFPLLTDLGTIVQHANNGQVGAAASGSSDGSQNGNKWRNKNIPQESMTPIPLSSILPPPGDATLPTWQHSAAVFEPYVDIFLSEKRDVTKHFIKDKRIVNMIVSLHAYIELESAQLRAFAEKTNAKHNQIDLAAYLASDQHHEDRFVHFTEILFKWMLWGNGVDLSMFSPEELKSLATGEAGKTGEKEEEKGKEVALHREEEAFLQREQKLMGLSDTFILADQIPQIVAHFKHLFVHNAKSNAALAAAEEEGKDAAAAAGPVNRDKSIDIVMDNTGVESVADMCFALWFLFFMNLNNQHDIGHHARRQENHVNFHVKPIPYYISDVTARDFALVLSLLKDEVRVLEGQQNQQQPDAAIDSAATAVRALRYFVAEVEASLRARDFRLDADTVWVQPCEFRELPPRIVNRYFYSQHIAAGATAADNLYAADGKHHGIMHRGNKDYFFPQSQFVLFKGDLNFRRLIGDRHWNSTDFTQALQHKKQNGGESHAQEEEEAAFLLSELHQDTLPARTQQKSGAAAAAEQRVNPDFQLIVQQHWPTHSVPICAIRTIKSEVCAGVPEATKERLDAAYWKEEAEARAAKKNWRTSGQYGVILFAHE